MAMTGLGVLRALGTTLRHFFRRPITIQYPEQRKPSSAFDYEVKPNFRGMPLLVFNPETKTAKCVGCGICVRACPHGIIHLATSRESDGQRRVERYEIEVGRCLFCGLCEEACPFGALKLSNDFELAHYTLYTIIYNRQHWLPSRPVELLSSALTQRQPILDTKEAQ